MLFSNSPQELRKILEINRFFPETGIHLFFNQKNIQFDIKQYKQGVFISNVKNIQVFENLNINSQFQIINYNDIKIGVFKFNYKKLDNKIYIYPYAQFFLKHINKKIKKLICKYTNDKYLMWINSN